MMSFNSYGEWDYYGKTTQGDKYYIDYESAYTRGSATYAWVLSKHEKPLGGKYRSGKQLLEINCSLKNLKTVQYIVYKDIESKDSPLTFSLNDEDEKTMYPPPGSMWHGITTKICKN
jgi:hypothetical protein